MKKYNVGIVGATGLVGRTLVSLLDEYFFPLGKISLFASSKSEGKTFTVQGEEVCVETLSKNSFEGKFDFIFFCAGGEVSRSFVPIALKSGAIVIDNSSVFRMRKGVSLIVPEVNLAKSLRGGRLIANPNCSTIQSVIPLYALEKKYGLKSVNFTTYQAVSGSGQKGINALNHTISCSEMVCYPQDITKTCLPEIGAFLPNGYTKEERKLIEETKKILDKPNMPISATCVRVPVENCHAVSVLVELKRGFRLSCVRETLSNQKGVIVVDCPTERVYPTSVMANGRDEVFVGRIRRDLSGRNRLLFYCVADNLRKGAASNALQIALSLIDEGVK